MFVALGESGQGALRCLALGVGCRTSRSEGATQRVSWFNIGFFTDLSSVSKADVEKLGMNRIHMFGGSMTLGLLGKQSRAWIGLAAEIGHTTTKVPGRGFTYDRIAYLPTGTLPEDGDSTLVRWTMTGILGSNYSFRE